MKFLTFTLLLFLMANVYATQNKKTIKIRLQAPSGNIDEATMYFDQGINPVYNYQEDAQKVFSGIPGVPAIYSLTDDNVQCSINGFGTLENTEVVPMGYIVHTKGIYKLSATLLDNFDPTSIIRLEDRSLGTYIDLRENFYQVFLSDSDPASGRFFLHVSYAARFNSAPADCSNGNGSISIATDTTIVWASCQLLDNSNHLINSYNNVNGSVEFTGLASGDYHTVFTYGGYTATDNFHLTGIYVVASIGVPSDNIFIDQDVTFNAIVTNATHFEWDFGDGTLIVGVANPTQTYLEPGNYTINLMCSNTSGCSAETQINIKVLAATGINDPTNKDISVYAEGKTVIVDMNDVVANNARIKVFNLLGQSVYNQPFTTQMEKIKLDQQISGYYLVSVENGGKASTKKVFIK